MSKVYFLFCIHNHQPVGNFENVIEEAYLKAYKPFLDVVKKYPEFKFALHCSGILWDYFAEKHPEYIENVKELVKKQQVEIISGGYYEPILSSIPQRDRIGQIKMMNEFIYKTFGVEAKGLWLTERVWEQGIVKDVVDAGIKYTLIDDYVFYSAGIDREQQPELTDYYVTEEEGRILYLFPISQTLRYYIPFKPVNEVIELFYRFKSNEVIALTMGDDGEKFGIWPKTYEHVYQDGWLENFLTRFMENKEWLNTITFTEYIQLKSPRQRIYLPTASYFEMGEWCLFPTTQQKFEEIILNLENEKIKQFLRGGYWKNFLAKYPEANNMHKKMLNISQKLAKVNDENLKRTFYKSQCNCAYWHGVFGGLYLPHLREAIYEHLINVEKQITKPTVIVKDLDYDGTDEICISSDEFNVYIKPSYGGAVYEIDLKKYDKNLLNVISRKKEAYHQRLVKFEQNVNNTVDHKNVKTIHDLVLVKEPGLSKKLYYDWHLRYSFLDHFLHPNTKFDDFYKSAYGEQGNFTIEKYDVASIDKKNYKVTLSRKGIVWIDQNSCDVEISKTIGIKLDNEIFCDYLICNNSKQDLPLWFATELNLLVFPSEQNMLTQLETDTYQIFDEAKKFKVRITLSDKALFWTFPIETISLSEAGFERVYQGMCILPSFKFVLKTGDVKNIKVNIGIY
ncbi:MAG: DUF1926 domain-containing protein [Endomicrobia bacterium]|nr:DUF1926 domain-containing protein [Endomicrobiia bacterium]MDW8055228.1 DUF1926 domain-containing protein [Elusimicrobiota bacterium]